MRRRRLHGGPQEGGGRRPAGRMSTLSSENDRGEARRPTARAAGADREPCNGVGARRIGAELSEERAATTGRYPGVFIWFEVDADHGRAAAA